MLFYLKIILHEVGFEPTRLSPYDLESHPLDHSGIHAYHISNHLRLVYRPVEPNPPFPLIDSPSSSSLFTIIG